MSYQIVRAINMVRAKKKYYIEKTTSNYKRHALIEACNLQVLLLFHSNQNCWFYASTSLVWTQIRVLYHKRVNWTVKHSNYLRMDDLSSEIKTTRNRQWIWLYKNFSQIENSIWKTTQQQFIATYPSHIGRAYHWKQTKCFDIMWKKLF